MFDLASSGRRPACLRRPSAFPAESSTLAEASRRCGFTLIELLIAVFLLSVGILGVAQVFAVADRHTGYAREETVAVSLVQEIREKMLSETFADLVSIFNGVDTADPTTIPTPAEIWAGHVHDGLGETGRGTIVVTTPAQDSTLVNGMVGVTVTVSWSERGQAISLPMRFIVADTAP